MAAVPSQRTSLEQRLAARMWSAGVRGWRRNSRVEGTRPDFTFTRHRVVVFADGCFWHGCPECGRRPATNTDYWDSKIGGNWHRDRLQDERLGTTGWKVLRFWGHEIERQPDRCVAQVCAALGRVADGP